MGQDIRTRACERVEALVADTTAAPSGQVILVRRWGKWTYLMPEFVLELNDDEVVDLTVGMLEGRRS